MNLTKTLSLLMIVLFFAACLEKETTTRKTDSDVLISEDSNSDTSLSSEKWSEYGQLCFAAKTRMTCESASAQIGQEYENGRCIAHDHVRKFEIVDPGTSDDMGTNFGTDSRCKFTTESFPICFLAQKDQAFGNGGSQVFYRRKNGDYEYLLVDLILLWEIPGTDWKICNKGKDVDVPGCQLCNPI